MRRIAFLLLPALLSGCVTFGEPRDTAEAQPKLFDSLPKAYVPSSVAIGDDGDVANHRAVGLGLVNIPALSKYLNELLRTIKREAKLADAPGRVFITASGDPKAEASADGNIYVSMGLLRNIESEDEIVSVLAHEFAHVALGHHDSDIYGNYQKQIQMAYALIAQLQSSNSGQGGQMSGKQNANLQKLQLVVELTDKIAHPAWKRHQERQADRLAVDFSTRLNYSFGRGIKSILEKLATLEESVEKEKDEAFQQQMNEQLKSGKLDLGNVIQQGLNSALEKVSRGHDSGSERVTDVIAYHETHYDDLPSRTPRVKPWQAIMANASVKAVVENYRVADDASLALLRNDRQRALKLARQAARPPTENHPYTLMMLAKAQNAAGDQNGYQQTIKRTSQLSEPVWALYEMRAEVELQQGNHAQAERVMEEGYRTFGSAAVLRPQMIGFYNRINRREKANAMVLDCSFRTPEQRDKCMSAGGNMGQGRNNRSGR